MASIAVVRGGRSLEREISLRSGHHIAAALRHRGHDVREIDVDERLTEEIAGADAAFVALHGRDGEDGTLQSALDALGLPYTGSDPLTCRLCFDKALAKGLMQRAGIPTPDSFVVGAHAVRGMGGGAAVRRAAERLGYPVVVKPCAQGSALGFSIVDEPEDLSAAVVAAFDHGDRVLLERFVQGAELAVSVVGPDLEALPPVEIRTRGRAFDFQARVSPGAVDYLCPAECTDDELRAVGATAREVARRLGVRDFARVDMILTPDGPTVLDVKTCPGLTETSLLPVAVAEAGGSFDEFASDVAAAALTRTAVAPA